MPSSGNQVPGFLVIEGNIGAGKTSLVKKIAADYNLKEVYERFSDNPFLPKFYQDSERYAFPLELSFLADRYNQINHELTSFSLFSNGVIADYFFPKTLIFARKTLSDDEFELFSQLFHIIFKKTPRPDKIVFLWNPIEKLLANISKRGREYEQQIRAEYLKEIHDSYIDFFNQNPIYEVQFIDCTHLDFVNNEEDYRAVCHQIFGKCPEPNVSLLR